MSNKQTEKASNIANKTTSNTAIKPDTPTILKQIVADKRQWIAEKQAQFPLASFQSQISKSERDFYTALQTGVAGGVDRKGTLAYILECKKASPSKGVIRADFSPTAIAKVYKNYASAISVLTDEKYFQGDFSYIQQVREVAHQPILCKDFMVSEYQVYLARYHQADAILLMLSVLDDEEYRTLASLAHSLGMGVLTESANENEVQRAINLGAKVIGINNRNLHDLSVDIKRTPQLAMPIATNCPADTIIVSESGIKTHDDIKTLQKHAHAFLIGSSLMAEDNLDSAVRCLLYGENKVCGLTRAEDAKLAYESGAYFGGLIFADKSKRKVNLEQAQQIQASAPLKYVGVFQNQTIELVCELADKLQLFAVQLHGDEDKAFVRQLRERLPDEVQIWKAVSVDVEQKEFTAPDFDYQNFDHIDIDRYVIDSKVGKQQGGTGKTFDWSLVPTELKAKSMLAGGLTVENIGEAKEQGFIGLDINSGAESHENGQAGIKDKAKLQAIFTKLLLR